MSYVNHKFSQYIDQEFSYNNSVNKPVKKLETQIFLDGNVSLEPRLFEYIKKKKYYRDNNIEELVPLEKQFLITEIDKSIIRDFLKGKKNMYSNKKYLPKYQEMGQKFEFLSEKLKNDKRIPKIDNMKNPYRTKAPEQIDNIPMNQVPNIMGARDFIIKK
ncbi:hypothetical protein Hokovirus_2_112 [Hokovirus HKV1]|uniref:Uncharacterized protein n=1 Tax=Hokovirus HKV1 TaxID=1977638 RepID=A0A1V0SFU1_9VIRU|nr:hypothetical protein Hokovirus_2_112 [Hokovirus HKV1]